MPRLIVRLIWPSAVFYLSVTLFSVNALAEGKRLFMEYNYLYSCIETKNKTTGQKTDTEFSEIVQRYNLDLSKTIYPFLTVRGGGLLEWRYSTSTTQDVDTKTRKRVTKPFVRLDLNNPLYTAGIGWRKTEIKERITGLRTRDDFKEDIDANLGWRPAKLPEFGLFFTRTHIFDNLDTVDSIENLVTFNARYIELKNLLLGYTYTRTEREDRISNLDSLRQTHNGRVDYSRSFLDRRLSMDTGLRITQTTNEFSTSAAAGATVLSPQLPSAGLFSVDDTPEDGPALASTPAVVDGDTTASVGIDIGLAGDETTLTNIGLDFGIPVPVDTIYVWVDRTLNSTIADSFRWLIYTSPDNTDTSTWTLHATVSPAAFGLFQNRFEITFPQVQTRFIKVVTRPLSPAVPGAGNFPNIFVTEMEGFTTISVPTQGAIRTENLNVNYNLNLQARASDKTTLGYNLFYRFDETDPSSQRRTTLSNGIYVNHIFNEVFTGSARLFRDDKNKTAEEKRVEYTYSASLRAAYVENFSQTLSYNGTHVTEQDGSSYTNSILLRNSARLYRGWDAFVDAGYSWDRPLGEGRTTSTLVRVGMNLLPNEKISINMNYAARWSSGAHEPSQFRGEGEVQVFFAPFRTLSFVARVNFVDEEDDTRSFQNYSVNWSPFPEGALELFFQYSEQLKSEDDREDRIIGPGLRWRIRRGASLELFYNLIDSDSNIESTESKNFMANLRIAL